MGGFDDHIAIMGDWMLHTPSPRAFFSPMISDDAVARLAGDSGSIQGPAAVAAPGSSQHKDHIHASLEVNEESKLNTLGESKMSSRGGLVERIAARAGFNAPRLNTESIRPAGLSKPPEVRSPYLTIPPGLSPTTLLDSPVLVNSLVLPSPTTGKFSFAPSCNNPNSTAMADDLDKGKENTFEGINTSSFAFKPFSEPGSFAYFNGANKVTSSGFAAHSFPSVAVPVHSDTSFLHQNVEPSNHNGVLFQKPKFSESLSETNRGSNFSSEQICNAVGVSEHSPPLDEPNDDDGDQRSNGDANVGGGPAEDGYNWRKYGQKQVKGSEYPRSYYKCTHPNCPVKKKVERSHEGHITEIIYKGAHDHPKPPPNRRSSLGASNAIGEMQLDSENPVADSNCDLIWSSMANGNTGGGHDWSQDNLEASSSAPLSQDYGKAASTLLAQSSAQYESGDAVDVSSTFSNDEDEDDRVTHGSVSLGYDGEGDESESKRRRAETYAPEMSGATRAIREPRVVVQTTSEVDILDDGYRWRKYGQKVVKGNPNPRSYYKCTSAGCNVRKHVERASHDLKSVITTYEGKHNHDVPAARNSSHMNSGGLNTFASQQAPATAASSQIHRPEPSQVHGTIPRFEGPPLNSFGLPGRQQLIPGPGFGYGVSQPGLTSLEMVGFGPNQGKLPVMPVHPYLGNETRPLSGMGFMMPKGEPKLEPVTESGLNSNGPAVYQQFMGRLPLGPH